MISVFGRVVSGVKDFSDRMTKNAEAFLEATGEILYPGTLNIDIGSEMPIPIKEHFRLEGKRIGEREDFLFEICRANGIWGYRVRPFNPTDGSGGHGDHVLEIACLQKIPGAAPGREMRIDLFRDVVGAVEKRT